MGQFSKKTSSMSESVAILTLVAIFFLASSAAVIMGVSAYRSVAAVAEDNDIYRTALAYVTNQVRRADQAGGVNIGSYYGLDALMLKEEINETVYVTYIYCYENTLRELFVEEGNSLEPSAGVVLMDLAALAVTGDGQGRLALMVEDGSGRQHRVVLAPRSGIAAEAVVIS